MSWVDLTADILAEFCDAADIGETYPEGCGRSWHGPDSPLEQLLNRERVARWRAHHRMLNRARQREYSCRYRIRKKYNPQQLSLPFAA